MNPSLKQLKPYPFERLKALLSGVKPPEHLDPIALSIGEPQRPSPQFVLNLLSESLPYAAKYPTTRGLDDLRTSICDWASARFSLAKGTLDPDRNVLPVNGTREALFAFTQVAIDRDRKPLVVAPNPFYQIYEGAALLAGAQLHLLPTDHTNNFLPDFEQVPADIWQQCQIVFICSPGNPTGAVAPRDSLKQLISLADQHDFVIASDECYSEIYCDHANPPIGLLEVCAEVGRDSFEKCIVFHSLSKRSNLPGLRSGFVAGDANLIETFFKYRTYHGCAMPIQHQLASAAAWRDEAHVQDNRAFYTRNFQVMLDVLGPVMDIQQSDASFYLWPHTPIDDERFCRELFEQEHVTVLPGSYLSRTVDQHNPGENRIRMALVTSEASCHEAALRIRRYVEGIVS